MSSCLALRARTSLTAALVVLAAAAGPARAGDIGGTIQMEVQLANDNGTYVDVSDQEIIEFFNWAHCFCADSKFAVKVQLVNLTGGTVSSDPVEIWVGNGCDGYELTERQRYCTQLDGFPDVHDLLTPQTYELSVHEFMFPPDGVCTENNSATSSVYALVDDSDPNDTTFQASSSVEIGFDTKPPPLPANPAASPGENAIVIDYDDPTSNEGDVWEYQALCQRVGAQDLVADDLPRDDPSYETSEQLCSADDGTILQDGSSADGGVPDAGVPDAGFRPDAGGPPADADTTDADTTDADTTDADTTDAGDTTDLDQFYHLDPTFVCGTSTGNQIRVEGLENGVTYRVAILSVDQARNVSGRYLGEVTPAAVTDFWEDYHNQGGNADGGVCLVTSTFGDDHPLTTALRDFRDHTLARFALGRVLIGLYYATIDPAARLVRDFWPLRVLSAIVLTPLAAAAALWEYTGPLGKLLLVLLVVLWRRRHGRNRRAALAAVTATLLLFGMSVPARAQTRPYTPYWDQFDEPEPEDLGPPHLNWNFEFKLGPYLPAIDSEFQLDSGQAGPYESMFGKGSSLMGILELQRFFLWPAGQLGVGASIGLMGNTAHAFTDQVDENGQPIRSTGDTTSFRLIPTALNAVYRFTELDDRWGVPLVPYGKIGLSYYLWWIDAPSGDLARVPKSPDCTDLEAGCASNRALGASIGWQVALGLAIRAERIDHQAELNLRNEMGIEHAGFFAELMYAKVDHFGASDRLRVGDLTWFGGITFEF